LIPATVEIASRCPARWSVKAWKLYRIDTQFRNFLIQADISEKRGYPTAYPAVRVAGILFHRISQYVTDFLFHTAPVPGCAERQFLLYICFDVSNENLSHSAITLSHRDLFQKIGPMRAVFNVAGNKLKV
jgi:hypothetical protein